jgi:hypothetical protein
MIWLLPLPHAAQAAAFAGANAAGAKNKMARNNFTGS